MRISGLLIIAKTWWRHSNCNSKLSVASNSNEPQLFKRFATNSESPECSAIGSKIMGLKGNAMDAAVATAICIGVINSFSSGIGGGGFLMIRPATNDRSEFDMFDFRETAPGNITTNSFKKNPKRSLTGGAAVGVPGEVMGLFEAHKKYGKLPWSDLFTDSIKLAQGFRANNILIKKLKRNRSEILLDPGLRSIYTTNGELIKEGDIVKRENLANTLQKIANDPMSFYTGEIASSIVNSIQKNGGFLTLEDMALYRAKRRDVLSGRYQDYDVYTTSLPTAGVLLIAALRILDHIDYKELKKLNKEDGLYLLYQILIETFKFTFTRRGDLGDPDFMTNADVITSLLISDKIANKVASKINLFSASKANDYGEYRGFTEDHGTTHFNIVDENDMIVQVTSTINLEFGAKFMDPETGIIFNNQISDFFIPNVENPYNLAPMPENYLAPYKRPFSSAAPVLLIKKNETIAIGAAGGTRIPTAILGTIAYISLGIDLADSILGCRIHNQLDPGKTFIEPTFPPAAKNRLEKAGQLLEISEVNTLFTSVQALRVKYDKLGRTIQAVSDPRKGGLSAGL